MRISIQTRISLPSDSGGWENKFELAAATVSCFARRTRTVGRLVGRSVGRPVGDGRSVGRSVRSLDSGQSFGRSVGPSVSVGRSVGRSAGRPVGRSVGRSINPVSRFLKRNRFQKQEYLYAQPALGYNKKACRSQNSKKAICSSEDFGPRPLQ